MVRIHTSSFLFYIKKRERVIMFNILLALSILYIFIICGVISVIVINLVLFALEKLFEFDAELELMDEDYIVTKDGEKIPYDEDTQE